MLGLLGRAHDRLTSIGFAGGATFVAVIAISFWYEVVARYFFNAPTAWAYDLAAFSLCPMIFLTLPAMTQRGAHIVVAYLLEAMPRNAAAILAKIILLAAACVCLFCAWIGGNETLRQYTQGVVTITVLPVSKWWISIFIPYGMLSSGTYFLRHLFGETPQQTVPTDVAP